MQYLWVAIGGAIGSVARFWLGNAMAVAVGAAFPWGTLLINIVGSFVISFFGVLTGAAHRFALPYEARIFVTVGLCGGFTTFSSFSLQTVELARAGQPGRAAAYVAASVIICLAACAFGVWAATAINHSVGPRAA
jgi:CrcB protein